MKKRFALVLAAMVLVALFPATALALPGDTGTDGDYAWLELADGSVAITGYTGAGGVLDIPDTLDSK